MSITIYLEIAIGVVFVWLLLAVGVMAWLEWVAAVLGWRSKDLKGAIRGLLQGDQTILTQIYSHPLVLALSKHSLRPWFIPERIYSHPWVQALSRRPRNPSYIPDRTFALALFDIVMTAGTDESLIQAVIESWRQKVDSLPQMEEEQVRQEVMRALDQASSRLGEIAERISTDSSLGRELSARLTAEVIQIRTELTARYPFLRQVLDELPRYLTSERIWAGIATYAAGDGTRARLAEVLSSLLTEATTLVGEGEELLAEFRTGVETYFNDTMDRLSGWYKRKAQLAAFLFGLVWAITLNVDSLATVTTLYREPTARAAVVAAAGALDQMPEIEEDPLSAIEAIDERLDQFRLPAGWVKLEEEDCASVRQDRSVWEVRCIVPVDAYPEGMPTGVGYVVKKLAGWSISGLAAAQGAPFWFELLKKLVNVRSAGKNPAEKPGKKDKE